MSGIKEIVEAEVLVQMLAVEPYSGTGRCPASARAIERCLSMGWLRLSCGQYRRTDKGEAVFQALVSGEVTPVVAPSL